MRNSNIVVSILVGLCTSLITWAFYTIHALEGKIQAIEGDIAAVEVRGNIYNGLFQELYELHGSDRRTMFNGMHRMRSYNEKDKK